MSKLSHGRKAVKKLEASNIRPEKGHSAEIIPFRTAFFASISRAGVTPRRSPFRVAVRAAIEAYEATGHMIDAALAYAEHGYPISPVTVRTKSPVAPADKDEHGNKIDRTGSFYKATINPQQIHEWWDGHEYLIALECGPVSGIWMADVDTAEDHASAGVDGWNKLLAEHPTFKTREHRSATGGPHVIFKWDDAHPITNSSGDLPEGIQIKSKGGSFILPPSRRKQRAYTVFVDVDPIPAAEWLYDLLVGAEEHTANEELVADDIDKLAYAVSIIPNDFKGREEWKTQFAMPLWGATNGSDEGFAIFEEFNARWSKRKGPIGDTARKVWYDELGERPPSKAGAGTIFYMADQAKPGWRDDYEAQALEDIRAAWAERAPKKPQQDDVVDDEIIDIPEPEWPTLDPAAMYGLAGEVVRLFEPHTEADPVALLIQFLVSFGNAIGRCAYYLVEGDRHYTNLFDVLVGRSSKARKGTSAGRIRQLMKHIERYWEDNDITGGLSSGEGVIWRIHDEIRGPDKHGNDVVKFAAIDDKRLMLDEREFAQVLTVMKREGNTLGVILRDAWDGRNLAILTRTNPTRATDPHVSISAHITEDELRYLFDQVSMANGWGNRFLFACVKRARELPHSSTLTDDDIKELGNKIRSTIYNKVHGISKQITMNAEAHKFWTKIYHDLSQDRPGLLGAVTARGEAQTIRLALLYAVLDGSDKIKVVHLKAALALWKYSEDSTRYLFGESVGDRFIDELLQALRRSGGMSRNEIRNHFQRHQSKDKIDAALVTLQRQKRARCEQRERRGGGAGRAIEFWTAVKS